MYKKLIKTLLKNEILDNQLKTSPLIDIVLEVLPGKFSSLHNNIITKKSNSFRNILLHFLKIIFLSFKTFLKPHIEPNYTENHYDLLILVPNNKFTSYYDILCRNLRDKKIAIVSISKLNNINSINLKSYKPNRFYISFALSICLFSYSFSALYKKTEFHKLLNNLELLQKLILNILLLNYIFKKFSFKRYFSLMPNIDHHYIIETYFSNFFNETYAIRPTATAYSEEHKYIRTQNLFYKSTIEKEIYAKLLLDKNIKLLPSSLMLEIDNLNENKKSEKRTRHILFLDTCLLKIDLCNLGREEALRDYYKYFNDLKEYKLYHKFHPGLNNTHRKKLQQLYDQVTFIDDSDTKYLDNIDLLVGFYSTVFQTAILRKIPIIMIANNYNYPNAVFSLESFDLESSPIVTISNTIELQQIIYQLTKIKKPLKEIFRTSALYDYYTSIYNYPAGLYQMLEVLQQ